MSFNWENHLFGTGFVIYALNSISYQPAISI